MNRLFFVTFAVTALFQTGCRPATESRHSIGHSNNQSSIGTINNLVQPVAFDPCSLALAPHSGPTKVDQEITRLQRAISASADPAPLLERLGWTFVTKARASFDPGFYKLAEQCAACLESRRPASPEAILLRGHVLQNLHRFKEAEALARELIARRGLPSDFGLLGDVLMEQGNLAPAIEAYQTMVDLKPDAQAYARIAQVRWLRGDLSGAREVMRLAAGASSPQIPEASAWVYARLAFYELQANEIEAARRSCAAACEFQEDYPPALLVRGRILLAEGKGAEAVEPLLRAARMNPLPEYQWALAEALRETGDLEEARKVESELEQTGAASDPRTFALFLATRGLRLPVAVDLARRELSERADVHTHDALAWALAASGRWADAQVHSEKALAEGTPDPRLHLHAGIITAKLGRADEAREHLAAAAYRQHALLPSERAHLANHWSSPKSAAGQTASSSREHAP